MKYVAVIVCRGVSSRWGTGVRMSEAQVQAQARAGTSRFTRYRLDKAGRYKRRACVLGLGSWRICHSR